MILICTYSGPFITKGRSMGTIPRKLGNEGALPLTVGPYVRHYSCCENQMSNAH